MTTNQILQESSYNFGHLPPEHSRLSEARVVVAPVPYEATTSYRTGTKDGPAALLRASWQVELYDEELDSYPYELGIATLEEMPIERTSYSRPIEQTRELTATILDAGKWPMIIGGEHSLSQGCFEAALERYPNLSILHFDAHGDLRDTYEGSPYSHACVMHRAADAGIPIVQVGIRNISREEIEWLRREKPPIKIFWARQFFSATPPSPAEVIAPLGNPVWITIDLDAFDPSEMPAVGTPEPGGLGWYQVLDILREVFQQRQVVGCDVVELSPVPGQNYSEFMAARLVYRIIGYYGKFQKPTGKSELKSAVGAS